MADNNLLEALSKAVGVETTTSKILSNGKTATLKTINVKQQKEILKTALEGLLSPISLYTVANQIIKNNYLAASLMSLIFLLSLKLCHLSY